MSRLTQFLKSILSNLATLLLSFFLATIIWVTANQAEDPTITKSLQIPIELIGQPDNTKLILPIESNRTLVLTIQGATSTANDLTASDFSASVDLSNAVLGEETALNILVPQSEPSITLFQSREQLVVHLEQLDSKSIPIEADIRGDVARGHSRGEETFAPAEIIVTGTTSELELLSVAKVIVSLDSDDRESKVITATPIFYDAQGNVVSSRNLQLSSQDVEVTIPINEAADFAEKSIMPDVDGEPASGYRVLSVTIEPTSVFVQGRPTQLGLLSQIKTETIDITGLTETFVTQTSLALPEGIELDQIVEITVSIEIEPFESSQTYNKTIEVQGLGEGLEVILEPATVQVVLFGPSPALNTLVNDEVLVTVDLLGLEAGEYTGLEPQVVFPERGIEQRSVTPPTITASITHTISSTTDITGTLPLTDTMMLKTTIIGKQMIDLIGFIEPKVRNLSGLFWKPVRSVVHSCVCFIDNPIFTSFPRQFWGKELSIVNAQWSIANGASTRQIR